MARSTPAQKPRGAESKIRNLDFAVFIFLITLALR